MSIRKIGFIGLGLIGGSIARKIKADTPEIKMIAHAHHIETITEAYEQNLIENNTFCEMEDFKDCDYIFLCCPVQKNLEYLNALKNIIKKDCLITDVGSVKTDIHREVIRLGLEENFIGGHPMTGSEKTGLENATPYLMENAYYILTPTAKTKSGKLMEFRQFVSSLGAIPLILDYEKHDFATASISHLPHIIASSLVNLIKQTDDEDAAMKTIAAGGFKDITRIASSSPVMWQNICLSNREQILKVLDSYTNVLEQMKQNIQNANEKQLYRFFESAKDYRDSITITKSGAIKKVYELYLDLLDEAGGIATVATILASNNISIKNIGIIHNREFEQGVLRLELYDEQALDGARKLLSKHHYTIYERS